MLFDLDTYLRETDIYIEDENTIRDYISPLEKSNRFFIKYPDIKEDIKNVIKNLYDKKYIRDLEPLDIFDKELKLIKDMIPVITQAFVNNYKFENKYNDILNIKLLTNSNNIKVYKIDFFMNTIKKGNNKYVLIDTSVNNYLNNNKKIKFNLINSLFDFYIVNNFTINTIIGTYAYDYKIKSIKDLKQFLLKNKFDKLPKDLIEEYLDNEHILYDYIDNKIILKNMNGYYEFRKNLDDCCVFKAYIKDEHDYIIVVDERNVFSNIFKMIIKGEYIESDFNIKIDNKNAIENIEQYMQYANKRNKKYKLIKL